MFVQDVHAVRIFGRVQQHALELRLSSLAKIVSSLKTGYNFSNIGHPAACDWNPKKIRSLAVETSINSTGTGANILPS
jgi:hypothetical protein